MRAALYLSLFVFGSVPAFALDCAKAKTPAELAICGDPATEAADDAMAKAYDGLASRLSPAEKAALLISQRRWLKRRADICLAREGDGVGSCFKDETQARRAFFAGEASSGSDPAQTFTPVLIQHVGKPNQYDLDVNAVKFSQPETPGEQLFNAKVDALLKEVPKIDQSKDGQNMVYSYSLGVSAPFASPKFVSAQIEIYDFSGGAHGNSSTSNFSIDLQTGKELSFNDLFDGGARQKFVQSCVGQIARQKQEKMPDAPFGVVSEADQKKTIEESVGDLTRWSFSAEKAEITFDPYALGAYVEGSYSCEFPAAFLRPLLKFDYLSQ